MAPLPVGPCISHFCAVRACGCGCGCVDVDVDVGVWVWVWVSLNCSCKDLTGAHGMAQSELAVSMREDADKSSGVQVEGVRRLKKEIENVSLYIKKLVQGCGHIVTGGLADQLMQKVRRIGEVSRQEVGLASLHLGFWCVPREAARECAQTHPQCHPVARVCVCVCVGVRVCVSGCVGVRGGGGGVVGWDVGVVGVVRGGVGGLA